MVFSDDGDAFDDEAAPAPAPAPKKSSLFGPSKFARPAAKIAEDDHDEAISLFNRRDEVFANVVRQRQEEAARKKERERLRRESKEPEAARDGKRRRLSREDESERENERLTSPATRISSSPNSSPKRERTRSPPILSVRNSRWSPSAKAHISKPASIEQQSRNPPVVPISLDSDDDEPPISNRSTTRPFTFDDDEDDNIVKSKSTRVPSPEPEEDPAQLSEEEFPELVAAAKARQKEQINERLAAARNKFLDPKNGGSSSSNIPQIVGLSRSDSEPDIVAKILVSSIIPGTTPVIVNRKLSQRLKDVRLMWVEKQLQNGQLTEDPSAIFLTWRGVRVFDITTCKSMGIKPGADGALEANGEGFEDGRISLNAWTQELFDEWKKQKMASQQRRIAGHTGDDSEAEANFTAEAKAAMEAEVVPKIRITLKAREHEDCKLSVKPHTPFHKLANAFRKHHGLGEKQVQFFFDGDLVDSDSTVEEAGLEDMDVIDVRIRD